MASLKSFIQDLFILEYHYTKKTYIFILLYLEYFYFTMLHRSLTKSGSNVDISQMFKQQTIKQMY